MRSPSWNWSSGGLVCYSVECRLGLFLSSLGLGQSVFDSFIVGRCWGQGVECGEIAQQGVCQGDLCHGVDVVVVDCSGHREPVLPFILLHVGGEAEEIVLLPTGSSFLRVWSSVWGWNAVEHILFNLQLLTKGFAKWGGATGVSV